MFRQFYPGVHYDSVYAIDFNKYYEQGYRGVLFDIDNTLVKHDAPADERAVSLFEELAGIGLKTCIISNNNDNRVKPFADKVHTDYVCMAGKPGAKGFEKAMSMLGLDKKETMMVGDQLFTDMWGANRAGILAVYTAPIARDPLFQIRLKRAGEKIVMIFYRMWEKRNSKNNLGSRQYIR